MLLLSENANAGTYQLAVNHYSLHVAARPTFEEHRGGQIEEIFIQNNVPRSKINEGLCAAFFSAGPCASCALVPDGPNEPELARANVWHSISSEATCHSYDEPILRSAEKHGKSRKERLP